MPNTDPRGTKVTSLEAAASLVADGDIVGIGGMTLYRKPMAFVRQLVRRRVRDLTLVAFTTGIEAELLAAGGCLRRIRSCYIGLEFLGLAPLVREAIEAGRVSISEETEYSIALGLAAALMRVPYLPARDALDGTDYFRVRPDLRRAPCPVTGEMLTWFPAVKPRVAVIHVPRADRLGNAALGGEFCVDAQLAMAAEITILTAERVVEPDEIRQSPYRAAITQFMVDAVVEVPGGAHPTSSYPDYPADVPHLVRYARTARRPGGAARYLQRYVLEPTSQVDYLRRALEDDR